MRKLTPKQFRIKLAKDVIAQIKAKKYIPSHCYTQLNRPDYSNGDKSAKEVINEKTSKCEVCGIGALVTSHIRFNNECSLWEYDALNQIIIHEILSPYFSEEQLWLIESAYERCAEDCLSVSHQAARFYGDEYEEASNRLVAIMKNIIENDGKFIIHRKYRDQARKYMKEEGYA
jgi:hypothetical protein